MKNDQISTNSPASFSIKPIISSGNPLIDGVLYHTSWDVNAIYYSFPNEGKDYDEDPNVDGIQTYWDHSLSYFEPVSDELKMMFNGIFEQINGFSQANFVNLDEPNEGAAIVRISSVNYPPNLSPYVILPDDEGPVNGDVWLNSNFGSDSELGVGSYSQFVSLRLAAFSSGLYPGHLENWHGALPYEFDSLEYSIATNRSHVGADISQWSVEDGGFPQSFMISDIAAFQYIYGANYGYNNENTVYKWSDYSGEMSINGVEQGLPELNRIFLTIWDGGGNDTFNLSNYKSDLNINLSPGTGSTFDVDQLSRLGPEVLASANLYNALLYQGDPNSLIENVVGGSGDDHISGNITANKLKGKLGDDILRGLSGEDTLIGGLGKDSLYGGANNDILDGGAGADRLFGSAGADTINGGLGNDFLKGGKGRDLINGGAGSDTLFGNGGSDTFVFDDVKGIDYIADFEAGRDRLDFTWFDVEYSDIKFESLNDDLYLSANGNTIVVLDNVSIAEISETDFVL